MSPLATFAAISKTVNMLLKGLQKLTLLDFPGRLAATVFVGGCNFRCPFCHNASLVLPEKFGPTLPCEEFFSFLSSRLGKLTGVCVSGGEPTLHPELPAFLKRIKDMGLAVKLDTNGYRPEVLLSLIDAGLVDYVAMDIKNSPARYGETVGIEDFDFSPIEKSVGILLSGRVEYEFRTTVMRELHTERDIREMGKLCAGAKKYFLQSFKDSGDLIGEGFTAYSAAEMNDLQKSLAEFVPFAQLRG